MSLLYNTTKEEDGIYFTTDSGDNFFAYFLDYQLPDSQGNIHNIYNFDFLCNEDFCVSLFQKKHDPKIRHTLIKIISDFFETREHAVIVYCCFNQDGYGRHRSITFRKWQTDLPAHISKLYKATENNSNITYSALLIAENNPLKDLIIEAFENEIQSIIKPTETEEEGEDYQKTA